MDRSFRPLQAHGWSLEKVMSDNASEFRSAEFALAIQRVGARHLFIHAGRPQTNGVVERVQETILEECWKPASPATSSRNTPVSDSTWTATCTTTTPIGSRQVDRM
jgi:transposase InsO family protein